MLSLYEVQKAGQVCIHHASSLSAILHQFYRALLLASLSSTTGCILGGCNLIQPRLKLRSWAVLSNSARCTLMIFKSMLGSLVALESPSSRLPVFSVCTRYCAVPIRSFLTASSCSFTDNRSCQNTDSSFCFLPSGLLQLIVVWCVSQPYLEWSLVTTKLCCNPHHRRQTM